MRWITLVCTLAAFVPAFGQTATPSSTYDSLLAKARTLIVEKSAKEAVNLSEQAIALNDKRWEAYVTAASAYSALQLYDDTISMLQMALGRAPEEKKPAIREAISEARRRLNAQSTASASPPPTNSQGTSSTTTQAEVVLWRAIENSVRAVDYQGYLSKYPDGTFAPVAKARLDDIVSKQAEETAQQQKAKESSLAGSAWQGTVSWTTGHGDKPKIIQVDLTLKLIDGHTCHLVEVGTLVSEADCTWQKIGTALYINYPLTCEKGSGNYALSVKDQTATGVQKSRCEYDQTRTVELKRTE
jgi:tetratricopeptide (TPR) repeat protein